MAYIASYIRSIQALDDTKSYTDSVEADVTISVTDYTKCIFIPTCAPGASGMQYVIRRVRFTSNTVMKVTTNTTASLRITGFIVEFR